MAHVSLSLHEQPTGMLMMTEKLLRNALLAYFALLPFDSHAGDNIAHVCDRVAIDSVKGDTGIWRDKTANFSRSRGLTGPIIYVEIFPSVSADAKTIRRMILWWSARPATSAICNAGPDIGQRFAVNCSQTVPGTELQLDVTFEPEGTHDNIARTADLVRYISDEVLCKRE